MTDIKNDDGLLPCDCYHILTATGKNLRKEVERLDALVSHYDALCERLSHENMVLKRHNPQPTEVCYNCCQTLTYSEKNVKLINTDNPPNSFDLVKMSHDGQKTQSVTHL